MSQRLLAVKIRRRSVAIAVFANRMLQYTESLQLCNELEGAVDATMKLLCSALDRFKPDAAAISTGTAKHGNRVRVLSDTADQVLLAAGVPCQKAIDKVLLEVYAVPKLKNIRQLRPIMQALWPHLERRQLSAYEAIALGFYVQVERLLSHH